MRNGGSPPYSCRKGNLPPARNAGIDYFRLAAAFMVIAIHIAPFSGWNKNMDFLLTYCLCRVAVPFFFMATGYFVLAPYVRSGFRKKRAFCKFMVKNTAVYLAVTVLYLPLTIYSGNLPKNVSGWAKAFLFDGTFYHLWYFPAVLLGCALLVRLPGIEGVRLCFPDVRQGRKVCREGRAGSKSRVSALPAVAAVAIAYVIGLFGDSYYGAIIGVPWLKAVYGGIFQVSSYTRNGIFFAPVFLMLGMGIALMRGLYPKRTCVWGLALSAVFLLGEGFLTYTMKWQRHNSMYFFLVPVMFFLFQLLLMVPGEAPAFTRKGSLVLYVVHPAVLVVLRGLAEWLGLTKLLVADTFVQYISVCVVSALAALVYTKLSDAAAVRQGRWRR